MPHAQDIAKADDAAQGSPLDTPLITLAVDIGLAVAQRLGERGLLNKNSFTAPSTLDGAAAPAVDNLIVLHVALMATTVLDESLGARTIEGRALRMALIAKLARDEMGSAQASPIAAQGATQDEWLTPSQAAWRLKTSRSLLSKLCKSGQLGEVMTIDSEYPQIRASAVQAYLDRHANQHEDAKSPPQAAVAAARNNHSDGRLANMRPAEVVPAGTKRNAPAKKARKGRR
ncbi:hypothetical protein [Variovorax sp. GT1P44]|uniref:hypothetical protein n=1 Tax=Variovorax sp. GT1P44 TaxID=3443742 RepID=UPI003F47681C